MVQWSNGRGALGMFKPLLGTWQATATAPDGSGEMVCTRRFTALWNGSYVRLDTAWRFASGKSYEELAMFGKDRGGTLAFWSFTSDGKNAQGQPADGSDVHPKALAFQAEMPAGTARFIYWPAEDEGFHFAVESRTKKGWSRFLTHHYLPA